MILMANNNYGDWVKYLPTSTQNFLQIGSQTPYYVGISDSQTKNTRRNLEDLNFRYARKQQQNGIPATVVGTPTEVPQFVKQFLTIK